MDARKIGENLRAARRRAGLTQEKLAEQVQVSTVFISQLETGARAPSLDTLLALSARLHVTLDALVRGGEEAQPGAAAREVASLLKNCGPDRLALVLRVVRAMVEE